VSPKQPVGEQADRQNWITILGLARGIRWHSGVGPEQVLGPAEVNLLEAPLFEAKRLFSRSKRASKAGGRCGLNARGSDHFDEVSQGGFRKHGLTAGEALAGESPRQET
jgi:hypothetical protein